MAQPARSAAPPVDPVQAYLESQTAAAEPTVVAAVAQTSITGRNVNDPNILTVRFKKWHAHATTAYQKGDFAGFPREIANRMIAGGVAVLANDPLAERIRMPQGYVTK